MMSTPREDPIQATPIPADVHHKHPRFHHHTVHSPLFEVHVDRETWSHDYQCTWSILNYTIDLANIWTFPLICLRHGGAAFLIPYIIMTVLTTAPLLFMELALGQITRSGVITAWTLCPMFRGVGICSIMLSCYVTFYYPTLIAVCLYYFVISFISPLPWSVCGHEWNTERCVNVSITEDERKLMNGTQVTAADEFYERHVMELHLSSGFGDFGLPHWKLVISLALVHIFCFLLLFKGIKLSGKISWIAASIPYVCLFALFVQAVILPGAWDGVSFFLTPKWSQLLIPWAWVDAAWLVIFSIGVGHGAHLAYASYSRFQNNIYFDCVITILLHDITSFVASVVLFSFLGHIAKKQSWKVERQKALTDEPGKVFEVYPEAISMLSSSMVYAVSYFAMLCGAGCSLLGGFESIITAALDVFHLYYQRTTFSRKIFTAAVVVPPFLINLLNTTNGGGYMWLWLEHFGCGVFQTSLLLAVFFQTVAISWVYGNIQFKEDIHDMLGFFPGIYWRVCWKFISPILILFVIGFYLSRAGEPLKYRSYTYPVWSVAVGWIFGCSSAAMIPIWAVIYMIKTGGSWKKRLALGITPEKEHRSVRRKLRRGRKVRRLTFSHWLQF